MMSISGGMSAGGAGNYFNEFQAEEYYTNQGEDIGKIWGAGAGAIGLKEGDKITGDTFKKLAQGFNPNAGEKLVKNAGEDRERAGFDVTFSAPKSVSLLVEAAAISGSTKIEAMIRDAQTTATQSAMMNLQENFVLTRVQDEGSLDKSATIKIQSKEIMYAQFQHDKSRALDPQLHNHNFIFNQVVTRDKNGNIKTTTMSNEEIFKAKMYLGQAYRNELAKELQKIGLNIKLTDSKNGFFEVEELNDKDLLDEFSKMSKILEEDWKLKLDDLSNKYPDIPKERLKERLKMQKRSRKTKSNKDEVLKFNEERFLKLGYSKEELNKILSQIDTKNAIKTEIKPDEIQSHILKSIEEIEQTRAVYNHKDIFKIALKYGLENNKIVTDKEYKEQLQELLKSGKIVKLDNDKYSTKEMIEIEKYIIKSIKDTKDKFDFKDENALKIEEFISKNFSTMTEEQKVMFNDILNMKDQFIAVQGDAGTGKTFSLKALNDFTEKLKSENPNFNQEIIGLSFTGRAADGLEEDSDIKSQTIHSFLNAEKKGNSGTNRLIIIDEAGMIGSKQTAELMRIAQKNNDKIVFIGDKKQLKAVEAGNIFSNMQEYGIKTTFLSQTMRQKTAETKSLVDEIKNKNFDKVFNLLDENKQITEVQNRDELLDKLQDDYLTTDIFKSLIVTQSNEDRQKLNKNIRQKLDKKGFETEILESINISKIEQKYAHTFLKNDILNIKGKTVKVLQAYEDTNKLLVATQNGTQTIDLQKLKDDISLYRSKNIDLDIGDKIIFTKNIDNRKKGIRVKNGAGAIIKSIDKNGNVETENGLKFNVNDVPFLDYGYAVTDYKSQGMTVDNVFIATENKLENTNALYTQATRAKFSINIYTSDKDLLKTKSMLEQQKESTLDYHIKAPETKEATKPTPKNQKSPYTKNIAQKIKDKELKSEDFEEVLQEADKNQKPKNQQKVR